MSWFNKVEIYFNLPVGPGKDYVKAGTSPAEEFNHTGLNRLGEFFRVCNLIHHQDDRLPSDQLLFHSFRSTNESDGKNHHTMLYIQQF